MPLVLWVATTSIQQLWIVHNSDLYLFNTETLEFEYKFRFLKGVNRTHLVLDERGHVNYVFSYNNEILENAGFEMLDFSDPENLIAKTYPQGINNAPNLVRDI